MDMFRGFTSNARLISQIKPVSEVRCALQPASISHWVASEMWRSRKVARVVLGRRSCAVKALVERWVKPILEPRKGKLCRDPVIVHFFSSQVTVFLLWVPHVAI